VLVGLTDYTLSQACAGCAGAYIPFWPGLHPGDVLGYLEPETKRPRIASPTSRALTRVFFGAFRVQGEQLLDVQIFGRPGEAAVVAILLLPVH